MDADLSARKPFAPGRGYQELDNPSRRIRSSVTNGKKAFLLGDGNSPWYRRFKDIAELHASDIGGAETLSEAQLSLCRRASTMEVELERMEGQLSLGNEVDLEIYSRIAGNLRRILEAIGIERKAKPVNGAESLDAISAYLASKKPPAGSGGDL